MTDLSLHMPPIRALNVSMPVLPLLSVRPSSWMKKKTPGNYVTNLSSLYCRLDKQHLPRATSNLSSMPWPIRSHPPTAPGEKVFDESPTAIATFFENECRDGNRRLINCLNPAGEACEGPPRILRYPGRRREPGESHMLGGDAFNLLFYILGSMSSFEYALPRSNLEPRSE